MSASSSLCSSPERNVICMRFTPRRSPILLARFCRRNRLSSWRACENFLENSDARHADIVADLQQFSCSFGGTVVLIHSPLPTQLPSAHRAGRAFIDIQFSTRTAAARKCAAAFSFYFVIEKAPDEIRH
jgi:hypothetical protein